MRIKKDGWVYGIMSNAWGKTPPTHISMCQSVTFFVGGLIVLAISAVVVSIVGLVLYGGGFLFALKPHFNEVADDDGNILVWKAYTKWPTIAGIKIYPLFIVVLLFFTILFLLYFEKGLVSEEIQREIQHTGDQFLAIGLFALICGSLYGLWRILKWIVQAGARLIQKTKSYSITKDYALIMKRKICPVIKLEIVD